VNFLINMKLRIIESIKKDKPKQLSIFKMKYYDSMEDYIKDNPKGSIAKEYNKNKEGLK